MSSASRSDLRVVVAVEPRVLADALATVLTAGHGLHAVTWPGPAHEVPSAPGTVLVLSPTARQDTVEGPAVVLPEAASAGDQLTVYEPGKAPRTEPSGLDNVVEVVVGLVAAHRRGSG